MNLEFSFLKGKQIRHALGLVLGSLQSPMSPGDIPLGNARDFAYAFSGVVVQQGEYCVSLTEAVSPKMDFRGQEVVVSWVLPKEAHSNTESFQGLRMHAFFTSPRDSPPRMSLSLSISVPDGATGFAGGVLNRVRALTFGPEE